jgi:hypothetical protein
MLKPLFAIAALFVASRAGAETPATLLQAYAGEAVAQSRAYPGPSVAVGDRFFHAQRKDWSCATCHTANPTQMGRHVVTSKAIQPLAPSANPNRFQDRARVEKWFKRNCNDTVGRECTAAEKADVLAYLISLGKRSQP